MKKQVLLTAFLLVQVAGIYAQGEQEQSLSAFKKGSETIGATAGWGVRYNNYLTNAKSLPTIAFISDRSSIEDVGPGTIGFGGYLGFKMAHYNYDNAVGDYAYWFNFLFGLRTTYHITALKHINNHFDPYLGVMVGARYSTYENTFTDIQAFDNNYSGFKFLGGVFAGAKYNFTRGFGMFAEFGFDASNFRIGINFNKHNK